MLVWFVVCCSVGFVMFGLHFWRDILVEEIPRQTKMNCHRVDRIVGCAKCCATVFGIVEVAHHEVEACVFQVKVHIGVYYGVVAHFYEVVGRLVGKLAECDTVCRGVVIGIVAQVGTKFGFEHSCNPEFQK